MKKRIHIQLFSLCILLLAATSMQAQWIGPMTPSPAPWTDCTSASANLTGNMPASNYMVSSVTHTIVGTAITIDVFITSSGFGSPVITPYTHTQVLGMLNAGNNSVTINQYHNSSLVETRTFQFPVNACCAVQSSFTASADSLCENGIVNLTGTSTSANQYVWMLDGVPFDTTMNTSQTFPNAGTYTISLAAGDGSCWDTSATSIYISAPPMLSISGTPTACDSSADGAIDLSVAGTNTYLWSNGDTTEDLSGLNPGWYVVTVTSALGCMATDSHEVMSTGPNPIAQFGYSSGGNGTVMFSDSSSQASSYSWNFGDGGTDTVANPVHTYAMTGTYNACLTITSAGGCIDSVCQSVSVTIIQIDEPTGQRLAIFPVPATNRLQIEAGFVMRGLELWDMRGRLMARTNDLSDAQTSYSWNLQTLSSGAYLLRIRTEAGGFVQRKVLIEMK